MTKRKTFSFLIPLVFVGVSSFLLLTNLDAKFSDLFQRILPSTQIREDVLLVGIDDYAIETIGSFPFTRDVYADCISIMEEMGADSIVFDLSFIDNARASVNDNFEPFYPDEVMEAKLKDSKITYLNFTFDYFTDISEDSKKILDEKGLLKNIEAKGDKKSQEFTGVVPTIPNFLKYAAGAGLVNADPDSDNYYRRVLALAKYDGEYYSALTFPAILKKLGNPKIIVENKKITLKDAKIDGKSQDIVIPRGNDGKLILKYPKMQFNDYNYLSIGDIYRIIQLRMYMAEDGEEGYIEEYTKLYETLKAKLASSICIVGTCATSTSDYGVNQIVAHPESFKLGGENREMTAIFTDIQKFSSFSELLTASELVALLNYYLTEMSDIIMEEGGTIDKYEGDAIIALVGAPLKMEDHALRAVKAALKMKQVEKLMNAKIKEVASQPKPQEMDENLYSAFKIMVENGEEIVCRRLDKVQVVNVNTPLGLYEPLSTKENATQDLVNYTQEWEKAMQHFDHKDFKLADELFRKLSLANPADKVAAYYVNILKRFFLKGIFPKEEDGVGVVYNNALNCFKLLSK